MCLMKYIGTFAVHLHSKAHNPTFSSTSAIFNRQTDRQTDLLTYLLTYVLTYLLTYLLTHLLTHSINQSITPWSRFLLEKLTGFQLVKELTAFYETRRFITAFTSARNCLYPQAARSSPHPHILLPENPS